MLGDGERKLAAALILDCVDVLKRKHPPLRAPEDKKAAMKWALEWEHWANDRTRELRFLETPGYHKWAEAAGLDSTALLAKINSKGLLYDPMSVVPRNLAGAPLVCR